MVNPLFLNPFRAEILMNYDFLHNFLLNTIIKKRFRLINMQKKLKFAISKAEWLPLYTKNNNYSHNLSF